MEEWKDALRDIFLATQEGISLSNTTRDRLVIYEDPSSCLLVCSERAYVFGEDQSGVPVLPCSAWVSTLLARESHREIYRGLAKTLLRMRKKAWVIRGRRIAQKVVDSCVQCRKVKAKKC